MLSGPHQKFCEGIVFGLNQTEAYLEAYPNSSAEAARRSASDLLTKPDIQAEISRMRKAAEDKAGSAVMTLAEKRMFLARVVRTPVGEVDPTSDLCQEYHRTRQMVGRGEDAEEWETEKIKTASKLEAIKIDNDLSGDGAEAEGNKALGGLAALILRLRK
ncbi:terminase small subunit [Prosthecobacter sp.]|jgi:phage terminase small subunit|uniref:terminase small subunit n=1 Tax=Prosthecobacter sp. TaxID=1965333 RepID=UPI0037C6F1AB